ESAAHGAGPPAHALRRDTEDPREIGGELMRALQRGVARVAAGYGVPLGESGARLHEAGDETVVENREACDVRGGRDGPRGGRRVAAFPVVAAIARGARMHG